MRTITQTIVMLCALIACATGCQQGGPHTAPAAREPATEIVEQRWPNGQLRERKEVLHLPDGTTVDNGLCTTWYDNGQKEFEAQFVQGKLHGVKLQWHRNGQKRTEQYYENGLRHGPRYNWDAEGRLRKEEHYVNDLPDGEWITWRDDGEIEWKGHFHAGEVVP